VCDRTGSLSARPSTTVSPLEQVDDALRRRVDPVCGVSSGAELAFDETSHLALHVVLVHPVDDGDLGRELLLEQRSELRLGLVELPGRGPRVQQAVDGEAGLAEAELLGRVGVAAQLLSKEGLEELELLGRVDPLGLAVRDDLLERSRSEVKNAGFSSSLTWISS
jgi:hypothetical protein